MLSSSLIHAGIVGVFIEHAYAISQLFQFVCFSLYKFSSCACTLYIASLSSNTNIIVNIIMYPRSVLGPRSGQLFACNVLQVHVEVEGCVIEVVCCRQSRHASTQKSI